MIIPSGLNDISNQEPLRYVTATKLGLIPTEDGERLSVLTSYFKVNECVKWKVQSGEWAQFWCTLLVFTWSDGKCFMPPIIVHQAKEWSQDIHHIIPLGWIVHHTPSSYMDRDRWLKSMTQLSNVCGAYPVNNKILFFDGHASHFKDIALRQIMCKRIQPFVLKSGNSINDQPNGNGQDSKLKSLYNVEKIMCMLKYGTTTYSPHHMSSILVESWDAFKMSAGNITRDSFSKTNLLPLMPPNLTTNTQACAATIQESSESKAE